LGVGRGSGGLWWCRGEAMFTRVYGFTKVVLWVVEGMYAFYLELAAVD